MAVARRAAETYAGNRNLAALAVAGSVGAGIADRFSDLELDCYWVRPPTDADRVAPVHALGGELTALWDYDQDDKEWSEDYRVTLAEAHSDADLGAFRKAVSERRRPIDPPLPGA